MVASSASRELNALSAAQYACGDVFTSRTVSTTVSGMRMSTWAAGVGSGLRITTHRSGSDVQPEVRRGQRYPGRQRYAWVYGQRLLREWNERMWY